MLAPTQGEIHRPILIRHKHIRLVSSSTMFAVKDEPASPVPIIDIAFMGETGRVRDVEGDDGRGSG